MRALRSLSLAVPVIFGCATAWASPTVTASVTQGGLFQNGSSNVTVTYGPSGLSERGAAGQFSITLTDTVTGIAQSIHAYCSDIFDYLNLPNVYTVGNLSDTLKTKTKVDQMNALLFNGDLLASKLGDAASAGLQYAMWEVQNESGTTGYDLSKGDFQVSSDLQAAFTAGQADLAHLADGSWTANSLYTVRQITAPGNQSLAYLELRTSGTPVPEPASLLLLGSGLAGLGWIRRRRSKIKAR